MLNLGPRYYVLPFLSIGGRKVVDGEISITAHRMKKTLNRVVFLLRVFSGTAGRTLPFTPSLASSIVLVHLSINGLSFSSNDCPFHPFLFALIV